MIKEVPFGSSRAASANFSQGKLYNNAIPPATCGAAPEVDPIVE